ncbi:hypothetical protein EP7_003598 [Isosphaeraceae bacterium EP7]
MGPIWRKLSPSGQPRDRGIRERRPILDALERRDLMVTQIVFPAAVPHYVFPPDGRTVTIHVSGFVATSRTDKAPVAHFRVVDKYRQYEPQGIVALTKLDPNGYSYAFDVNVPAKNGPLDQQGRFFNILVEGTDQDTTAGSYVRVSVPGPQAAKAAKATPKPTSTDPDAIPTTIPTKYGPQPLSPRQLNTAKLAYAKAHPMPANAKKFI